MTIEEYQEKLFAIPEYIKTNLITPITGDSLIKTRYITSEGVDDEQWIGYLRDEDRNDIVDIWLITFAGGEGLPPENKGMIGGFDKPVSLYIEYLADYRQGLDYNEDTGATNSEREFLKKVWAFDFKLESITDCLPNQVFIESHSYRLNIKQFSSDSCHRAQFVLNLKVSGNIL